MYTVCLNRHVLSFIRQALTVSGEFNLTYDVPAFHPPVFFSSSFHVLLQVLDK